MVRRIAGLLVPLVLVCGGCKLLAFMLPETTKTVPAEYPYLTGKRVCVVIRANMETLTLYPQVQLELTDHVRAALEANVKGATVVDPRKVIDFQRSDPSWETMDPAALGKKFDADRVLEIELTLYTTREPESEYVYRGHINAALRVFNTEYPNSQAAYKGQVQTVYPPGGPGKWGTDDRAIRRATMEAFGEDVAGKFYERTITVK